MSLAKRIPGGLADTIDAWQKLKQESYVRRMIRESNNSLIDFTDLTALEQSEIDLFWTYPGGELERKIALRLATRTAQEAVKSAMAWHATFRKPCYKCGLRLDMCQCVGSALDKLLQF